MRGDLLPDAVNIEEMRGRHALEKNSLDGSRPELWRTPQASEAGARVETLYTKDGKPAVPGQRAYRKTPSGKLVLQSQTINQQVEMVDRVKAWATPTVAETHNQNTSSQIYLQNQVGATKKLWATARAGMARGNNFTYDRGKGNIEEQVGASVSGGGKLNPRWVETLMGIPVGWTMPSCVFPVTIEPMNSGFSETASSQPQQPSLSQPS